MESLTEGQYKHINFEDTEKLFYDLYPYSAKVRFEPKVGKVSKDAVFSRTHIQECAKHSWFWNRYRNFVTFYFTHKEDLYKFVEINHTKICRVSRPKNDQALETLKEKFVVLKNSLYWNKFEYRLQLKRDLKKTTIDEYEEWLNEYLSEVPSTDYHISWDDYSQLIYLNDFDSVVMLKMYFGNDIGKISKAVLKESEQ